MSIFGDGRSVTDDFLRKIVVDIGDVAAEDTDACLEDLERESEEASAEGEGDLCDTYASRSGRIGSDDAGAEVAAAVAAFPARAVLSDARFAAAESVTTLHAADGLGAAIQNRDEILEKRFYLVRLFGFWTSQGRSNEMVPLVVSS
ncbi:hypothetical protein METBISCDRAFT_22803 [Metschnikowia bicuspidata]|uniref:Uncharacterized protein n=1 Tax=Metschnikowia bicuspidata TaxID=27322 RepID=A0A4V1J369_9ASCO|nr:hypothetical protein METBISCDRAFT_22803 [Metschnikowia bicuspidata]